MTQETPHGAANRRPLKARNTGWAAAIAAALARAGIKPNWISVASVAMASAAGSCLIAAGRTDVANLTDSTGQTAVVARAVLFYLAAAAFMQLRLLCNLFDGMVAVEGGMKSASGEIFNDLPDRIADPVILICAGYGLSGLIPHSVELGYMCGLAAVFVAYVRVLGVSGGTRQHFLGPMAKQHRMAIMTLAAVGSAAELFDGTADWPRGAVMATALILILLGTVVTIVRRIVVIVRELESA